MSMTQQDDHKNIWLSFNMCDDYDYQHAYIFDQIESLKSESIFDHSFDTSDSNKNFDCLSFMDFSSNASSIQERKEDLSAPVKSLFTTCKKSNKPKVERVKREKKIIPPKETLICPHVECGMTFRHKWIYERHMSSHSSFKFFKCQEVGCNKSYKSKENLNLHIKNIHEKVKPYQCSYCELKFSHRNGKTYHERKFHNNYLPHVCTFDNCSKSYASKSALNYHMTNQHNNDCVMFNNKVNDVNGYNDDVFINVNNNY